MCLLMGRCVPVCSFRGLGIVQYLEAVHVHMVAGSQCPSCPYLPEFGDCCDEPLENQTPRVDHTAVIVASITAMCLRAPCVRLALLDGTGCWG